MKVGLFIYQGDNKRHSQKKAAASWLKGADRKWNAGGGFIVFGSCQVGSDLCCLQFMNHVTFFSHLLSPSARNYCFIATPIIRSASSSF